ncbi:respiratory nitrate reductase subunit gamma [Microtetraspora niveoalba]|uniref:respiratory nitrate reductase subunit gamma n=1 Tax=Microtetraspora niveoalba TaxID=46175 RepID=UPI000830B7DC|nr:respiratory nitrate reductase subunit gamma [Microtetraspora niveoalba]
MNTLAVLLWGAFPYVALASFVIGSIWRYKYDKFGWTTRSSELYERRLLRVASPLFHFGILVVLVGHVIGLLIPQTWTRAIGLSENAYHFLAVALGTVAGACTLIGIALLIYRRRTVGPVFLATTRNDKLMYVVLTLTIVLGLTATVDANIIGSGYNYRTTISPWFRSIFAFQPETSLMAGAPLVYRIHALCALTLFTIWPYTRLVHVLTAPIGYLTRPYIVYRSRDLRGARGTRPTRRGWEPTRPPTA